MLPWLVSRFDEWLNGDDSAATVDKRLQVELINIRMQILDVLRQRDVIWC